MENKIPVYECKIMGTDDTGIFAISFVDVPANETNFIALNKQKPLKLALNKQKQMLTGVVLIPDQLIYRYDDNLGEYYIKFTAQDIERIAQKMMKTGLALNTTTHQHAQQLEGNYLTEIWLVSDSKKDKAVALGLGELPVGTLVASYKIEDSKYWHDEVLTGKVKGFSLEGIFNFNSVTMKKKTTNAAQLAAKKNAKRNSAFFRLLNMSQKEEQDEEQGGDSTLTAEIAKDETNSGSPFLIFDLADGSEVLVDIDGFATLDGEQMAAGEHALADGNFLIIDDSGTFIGTAAQSESDEKEEAPAQLSRLYRKNKASLKSHRIAYLEKELYKLKNEPSTLKAEHRFYNRNYEQMTNLEKMAAVIRVRRERQK